ncbi:MAG TPA: PPOX class F420-dependent oxidoreductase [Dehalococcoidia bacterium]|nr:PPOX class F420-dependent oxidoreductase [Dehalococcoidia bacterium]
MKMSDVAEFLRNNHDAVLTTFRRNGAAQMSIVTVGTLEDSVAFTTTGERAKVRNLIRNSRCSILVSGPSWRPYLVLEGYAQIISQTNHDKELWLQILRKIYTSASGQNHPDWDDYDEAMIRDKRVGVKIVAEKLYGTL